MRKKGRAHPDRLEATASHNTIKKKIGRASCRERV